MVVKSSVLFVMLELLIQEEIMEMELEAAGSAMKLFAQKHISMKQSVFLLLIHSLGLLPF